MQQPQPEMESLFDMATKDQILINMGTTIGKIEGTLEAFNTHQKELNDSLKALLEKHDARIDGVEDEIAGARNKLIGFGLGAGAAGGGIVTAIMKIFH